MRQLGVGQAKGVSSAYKFSDLSQISAQKMNEVFVQIIFGRRGYHMMATKK